MPRGRVVRSATVFDVFEMSAVLTRSITELCEADHQGDPDQIAEWTANKSPEHIRNWLRGAHHIWVAELDGRLCAVAGTSPEGEVSVLYVDPWAVGRGLGTALLAKAEHHLKEIGFAQASLESTTTALEFYRCHGWVRSSGEMRMTKRL